MHLNRELQWISGLLSEKGIRFWADSGTLLGLAREGQIMKDDHDIDLSMWAGSEPLLNEVLPLIKERGYRVAVKNYRGLNFKYKLSPTFKDSSLDIDISLFRSENKHAWCPQIYCMPYPFSRKHLSYYLYGLPRRVIQEIFVRKNKVIVNHWPWSLSYKVYVVWVPRHYFEETIYFNHQIPAPKDYRRYLSFRYGDWEVPRKDWFFIFDDGAIRHVSPDELIARL